MRKPLYCLLIFVFKFLGAIHPIFKVLAINGETEGLERRKKFEEARKIRHKHLNTLNKKYLSPLWRQEGFDLFYRLKDYQLSLVAFENAIRSIKLSPALYGVANPLDIYFGASMASVSMNDKEKTKEYFQEFT